MVNGPLPQDLYTCCAHSPCCFPSSSPLPQSGMSNIVNYKCVELCPETHATCGCMPRVDCALDTNIGCKPGIRLSFSLQEIFAFFLPRLGPSTTHTVIKEPQNPPDRLPRVSSCPRAGHRAAAGHRQVCPSDHTGNSCRESLTHERTKGSVLPLGPEHTAEGARRQMAEEKSE